MSSTGNKSGGVVNNSTAPVGEILGKAAPNATTLINVGKARKFISAIGAMFYLADDDQYSDIIFPLFFDTKGGGEKKR